jgi:hypothetical protein
LIMVFLVLQISLPSSARTRNELRRGHGQAIKAARGPRLVRLGPWVKPMAFFLGGERNSHSL